MGMGWRGMDTAGLRARRGTDDLWPPRREELLAAVGHLLDAEGWELIALVRRGDGLQMELHQAAEPGGERFLHELSEARLQELVREARVRRSGQRARLLLAAADRTQEVGR